jgi:FKBP-type peptidyl-prolyl cis-trans isomerase 2
VATAKQGDTVHVHYTGKLDDGSVFDSSRNRDPIEFTVGRGQVISGLETAVVGLAEGEKAEAQVPPEAAFGEHSNELVIRVQNDSLPKGVTPALGQRFEMTTNDGYKIPVRVTDLKDDAVVVDANHPLAGKELTFDLELVRIV